MTKTPEQIVSGLSDAQKHVLKLHVPNREYGADIWPYRTTREPLSFAQTARPMMDIGMLRWCKDKRKTATIITPLGLQCRAILQEQNP